MCMEGGTGICERCPDGLCEPHASGATSEPCTIYSDGYHCYVGSDTAKCPFGRVCWTHNSAKFYSLDSSAPCVTPTFPDKAAAESACAATSTKYKRLCEQEEILGYQLCNYGWLAGDAARGFYMGETLDGCGSSGGLRLGGIGYGGAYCCQGSPITPTTKQTPVTAPPSSTSATLTTSCTLVTSSTTSSSAVASITSPTTTTPSTTTSSSPVASTALSSTFASSTSSSLVTSAFASTTEASSPTSTKGTSSEPLTTGSPSTTVVSPAENEIFLVVTVQLDNFSAFDSAAYEKSVANAFAVSVAVNVSVALDIVFKVHFTAELFGLTAAEVETAKTHLCNILMDGAGAKATCSAMVVSGGRRLDGGSDSASTAVFVQTWVVMKDASAAEGVKALAGNTPALTSAFESNQQIASNFVLVVSEPPRAEVEIQTLINSSDAGFGDPVSLHALDPTTLTLQISASLGTTVQVSSMITHLGPMTSSTSLQGTQLDETTSGHIPLAAPTPRPAPAATPVAPTPRPVPASPQVESVSANEANCVMEDIPRLLSVPFLMALAMSVGSA
eukprot:TRINITY_DN79132_c0_g1_i1.p1 TRINITY_DN79132_c0_g1~~TRINITY_DN79132_c0_g1_i1.p1  ORF type:complete len:639 (+),score=80.75 TRINITY_DN79132_c0_g1_i1:242-1918(+)